MTPVLQIAFLHNFNLQFAEQPVDRTDLLVTQGILPLLDLYEGHPEIKADFFFTGYTGEYLATNHPDIVERVLGMRARGQVAIGTYTYTHPVLTLLPYEDVRRQLARGLQSDERVWGFRPDGLLLPEVSWDVTLPEIMPQLGLSWVVVFDTLVPRYAGAVTFPGSVKLQGINGQTVTGVLAHDALRDSIWNLAETGEGLEEYLANLAGLHARLEEDQLLALKTDAEFLYFTGLARLDLPEGATLLSEPESLGDMHRLYSALSGLPYVQFTTIPEYLSRNPPTEVVFAESKGGTDALDRWLRGEGRERLNILEADARQQIRIAGGLLDLSELLGLDPGQGRELYEKAWEQLLLAENSDGRGFTPHSSRKIFVAQAAVQAARLAQQAVAAISIGKEVGAKGNEI